MKRLSRQFPLIVRIVVLSVFLCFAVLLLIKASALANPDGGPADIHNAAALTDLEFDYMHSQAEWEMLKERSYPSKTLLDGPTLSLRQREAAAQLEKLERERPQSSLNWTNVGPVRIPSTGCGWGAENSGRVVALAVDPSNSSHWLIAAADGGIWQTTDAGGTWSPRTDDQSS